MPRAFDITVSTQTIDLNAERQGEIAFTVSNALKMPVRVRGSLEPSGDTRAEWLQLASEPEKELAPDGTDLFTARVNVPEGSRPGRYTFKLLVVSVANPDEHYARGPEITFEVPQPPPVPKPFPWRWVALIGGVVVIGGIVLAIILSRSGAPPWLGEACSAKKPCAEGLQCATETKVCVGLEGFQGCERGEQCSTGRCAGGTCIEFVTVGETCVTDEACVPPSLCSDGNCLLPDGAECAKDGVCISGRCESGACRPPASLGESCQNKNDCRSPTRCHQGICLMPDGATCSHDAQCINGSCTSGKCRAAPATCKPPCSSGFLCLNGRCIRRPVVRQCQPPCRAGFVCLDGSCQRILELPPKPHLPPRPDSPPLRVP